MDHMDEIVVQARQDLCTPSMARRVAAMLDMDADHVAEGQILPRGWQFIMLGGDTRRSALRSDGFPGLGVTMPDLGLPRLLLVGRTVSWENDILIGEPVERQSKIVEITQKDGSSGPMAFVTLRHELRPLTKPGPAIVETQTYALLAANTAAVARSPSRPSPEASATARLRTLTPDETLLFQYSALGFNSHKIHLDRDYARNVEGLPDLVVNGGLSTLLATEFLRDETAASPRSLRARHHAPLYCGRMLTIRMEPLALGWRLQVLDDQNILAVDIEVET
jgi:3-methylfumaryl-CoA hydratase